MRKLVVVVLVAALAACDSPRPTERASIECAAGSVTAQGSSAQANAVSAWIKDYQVSCDQATISYAGVGSSAGLRGFLAGQGDFAGSDSPIAPADRARATARCKGPALHLPMAVGPIALAYTVAGVDDLRLSPATIARIFGGEITRWNDPRVTAENPGVTLPGTPVRTVHRSDGSGTTDNFRKFLAATGPGTRWPPREGIGVAGSNRMAAEIERTDGAIGYVEASYARFHNLPTVRVGNASGQFVALSDAAAARTVAAARTTGTDGDLPLELNYRTGDPLAYPLVLVTYEIACRQGTSELAKSFLTYAASSAGQQTATRSGYAALPEELRTAVARSVASL
ncbi:phosphate ABC transporter substrate-binding protein PstS [Actinoplanes solisilvae]|uniref:phosphate ABC transporter substrate-binding protein PstS n=1 Tax=Actinoplanes solisilvae TaxID=2486853 RepID=UPI000FDAC525|nr:phosphate ABC transporter substrate-binding protein PstS [Actinoplanes solisilvae]